MNKQERAELIYKQKHKIIDGVEHKKCRQCEEFLPMTKEYYHKGKNFIDGFVAICKECTNKPEFRKPKKMGFNNYEIRDDYAVIFIDNGVGESYECLVDIEDIQKLKDLGQKWGGRIFYGCTIPYAITNIYDNKKHTTLLLHRFLMNVIDSEIDVDHINHNPLDNRKNNLRVTEALHNIKNRRGANKNNKTGVRNVNLVTRYGGEQEYWVQLMKNGERFKWEFPLDKFDEACKFAEQKRQELFGEFAGKG